MAEQIPNPDNEHYDANLEAEDEELSAGNNRLALIVGGILLLLILGYVLVPKGQGGGLASVTPSFLLDGAAVTGTLPTAEDSIAAGLKAAPVVATTTTADNEPQPAGSHYSRNFGRAPISFRVSY